MPRLSPRLVAVVLVSLVGLAAAPPVSASTAGGTCSRFPDASSQVICHLYGLQSMHDPSDEEVGYWAGLMADGHPFLTVARGIVFSTEYSAIEIGNAYADFLGRLVDPAGLDYWISVLEADTKFEHLYLALAASDEAEAFGTNTEFVQNVYARKLARAADPEGLDYWVGLLDGGLPRSEFVSYLLLTDEYASNVTQALYLTYTGRDPDADGHGYWSDFVALYGSRKALSDFIGTDEVYAFLLSDVA